MKMFCGSLFSHFMAVRLVVTACNHTPSGWVGNKSRTWAETETFILMTFHSYRPYDNKSSDADFKTMPGLYD